MWQGFITLHTIIKYLSEFQVLFGPVKGVREVTTWMSTYGAIWRPPLIFQFARFFSDRYSILAHIYFNFFWSQNEPFSQSFAPK